MSLLASVSVVSNRCRTCYLKLDDEAAQWKDVFLCHLPPTWDSGFIARMLDDVLVMASPDRVLKVESLFLVPRCNEQELQHGFVNMSSHEAACFVVYELGKSLFSTCGVYIGPHMNQTNMQLYLNLVMEQRDVVEHYVSVTRLEHLERLTREQRHVINTLVDGAALAQKRIAVLEHVLLMQQRGSQTRLLPK